MQPIFRHSKKTLVLMTVCILLTACSTFMGSDEDEGAGQFAVVKLPPRISEQPGKKSPAAVPAVSLKTNEPALTTNTAAAAPATKTAAVDLNQTTPAASQAKTTPVTPPKPLNLQADDASAAAGPMLFAPYIPTVREGELPRRWQKEPTYDFPWIPGSTPTRINEETVVGFGEQMLGRLYARAAFSDKPGPPPVISEAVQVKPLPPPAKKGSKNAKTAPEPAPPAPVPVPVVTKRIIQCEGGATCLDVARDELVEDAKAKGWEMMLSRRVSLHNSFQFKRGQRVVWIELNSNGKRDLDIEYTLLPVQNKVQRN